MKAGVKVLMTCFCSPVASILTQNKLWETNEWLGFLAWGGKIYFRKGLTSPLSDAMIRNTIVWGFFSFFFKCYDPKGTHLRESPRYFFYIHQRDSLSIANLPDNIICIHHPQGHLPEGESSTDNTCYSVH